MKYAPGFMFLMVLVCTVCRAQTNEVGIAAGFGFYHDVAINTPSGDARAGFGPRFAAGFVAGRRFQDHFGGEFRYTFQDGDSELRSGELQANLDAHAHSVSGDLLIYGRTREIRFQPYAEAGVGAKIYQATETPTSGRPLENFGTLNNGTATRPLITAGGGVQWDVRAHWLLRFEALDYMTPFPGKLFILAPGAQSHGWIHDFVPSIGISRLF